MNLQLLIDLLDVILGPLISVFGLFLSLIGLFFVWRQLRSIERNQQATTVQNIVDAERELWASALCDDEAVDVLEHHMGVEEGFQDGGVFVTPRAALWISMFLRQYENIYYQHLESMLPPGLFEHWQRSMERSFKSRYVRTVFNTLEAMYSERFKEFVHDELMPNAD